MLEVVPDGQVLSAFFVGYPSCRMVKPMRLPSLMYSRTARSRPSYEYMNTLQVVQVIVRTRALVNIRSASTHQWVCIAARALLTSLISRPTTSRIT